MSMLKSKIKIPKIKNLRDRIKNFPRILAQKAFLTFLIFFILSLIFGFFVYYEYLILEEKKEPEITEKIFEFDRKKYKRVLEILDEKEKKFNLIEIEKFRDPFEALPKTETSTIMSLSP